MQKHFKSILLASCLSVGLGVTLTACETAGSSMGTSAASQMVLPKMTDAASYGKAAAEWQLGTINDLSYLPNKIPPSTYNRGWVKGAFYIGLERFALKTNNQDYLQLLLNESLENGFELGERYWHGDDQIMGTIYSGVIERGDADLELLRPTLEKMDLIIEDRSTVSLEFKVPKPGEKGAEGTCQTRWCWADAIFMAPPAWAAVSNVTGDDKYRQYAVEEMVGWVQQIGKDPQLTIKDSSQLYGVGGFLLMASEMIEAGE